MMTMLPVSALQSRARQPLLQDAALAAGLLVVCLPLNNPAGAVRAVAAGPPIGAVSGGAVSWGWWTATAFELAGVTLRRRWPVPMLGVCALATAVHVALLWVVPTVVDAAAVVLLVTVAARCPRRVSSAALGALLVLVAVWCLGGAGLGRPAGAVPTFDVEVVHRLGPSPGPSPGTGTGTGLGQVVGRAKSSDSWGALSLFGAVLIAAWAVGSANRSRRAYLHQLHARAADLERERDQQAALAVAAERGRISRELHDVVAHGLSLIVIQAQGADAALDRRPADARSALQAIVRTGRSSLADMRRVLAAVGELADTWQPQPGIEQLPALLDQVCRAGTTVRFRVEGAPTDLPSAVDLSVYRIVQEALTNVMKHAGAGASADVVVGCSETEVAVEVCDDGRLRSPQRGPGPGGGNGLRGMERRVQLLGGRFSAGPVPSGGFRVRASLPLQER